MHKEEEENKRKLSLKHSKKQKIDKNEKLKEISRNEKSYGEESPDEEVAIDANTSHSKFPQSLLIGKPSKKER
ncbi:hypothetical protein Tco_0520817 [Tanacetum coccineum]